MTLKRVLMPVFLLGIIFGYSSVAHAQFTGLTCALSNAVGANIVSPVPRDAASGHTEPAGDVTITCTPSASPVALTSSVFLLDYGTSITNSAAVPAGGGIRLGNCTGDLSPCPTLGSTNTVSTALTITLPAIPGVPVGGSFRVAGVLVDADGVSRVQGRSSIQANQILATPGNGYFTSGVSDIVTVVSALVDPISSPVVVRGGGSLFTNGVVFPPSVNCTLPAGSVSSPGAPVGPTPCIFQATVTENAQDIFKTAPQFNPILVTGGPGSGSLSTGTGVNPPSSPGSESQVVFAFNEVGATPVLPPGVAFTNCFATVSNSDGSAATAAPSVSSTSVDSNNPWITVTFSGAFSQTVVESVALTCIGLSTTASTGPIVLPLAAGNITMQTTLAPCTTGVTTAASGAPFGGASSTNFGCTAGGVAGALNAVLSTPPAGVIPRYQPKFIPASPGVVVLSITPSTTTALIPYATCGQGGVYDTGIAISNTTSDPFGVSNGGAVAQNGTITFNFFPTKGATFAFTTGATGTPAGNGGLTNVGTTPTNLNAGDTYSVLLSQLLTAAGKACTSANPFSGYVFVTTNFTNAHGIAFVSTAFGTSAQTIGNLFTSASPLLVMPAPTTVTRQVSAGRPVESLGQ